MKTVGANGQWGRNVNRNALSWSTLVRVVNLLRNWALFDWSLWLLSCFCTERWRGCLRFVVQCRSSSCSCMICSHEFACTTLLECMKTVGANGQWGRNVNRNALSWSTLVRVVNLLRNWALFDWISLWLLLFLYQEMTWLPAVCCSMPFMFMLLHEMLSQVCLHYFVGVHENCGGQWAMRTKCKSQIPLPISLTKLLS